jgi:hypothetical protein
MKNAKQPAPAKAAAGPKKTMPAKAATQPAGAKPAGKAAASPKKKR